MAHGYPDFEGDKSDLFPVSDWATKEGTDKTLTGGTNINSGAESTLIDYTVPTGKAVYIDYLVTSGRAIGRTNFLIGTTSLCWIYTPADDAFPFAFSPPKKAIAGQHIYVYVFNHGAATAYFAASIGGREVDA